VAVAPEGAEHRDLGDVVIVPWRRNERGALTGLKTTSYGENALAYASASERGADEAIFANTVDELCEGTGSNVFLVRDGELVTPPLASGCLAGITRALVCEAHGAVEIPIPLTDFAPGRFDEAFITSSVRGVLAIGSIDGVTVATHPGPVTEKIRAVYDELVATNAEP
jgi:branched-chain amino acid aminotransferase